MKAVLAGARHAKYRQSALRTVLPRLQQLEHYLDLIHSDEKRGQIRLLLQKAPPLQWYLTNHPTLARKAVLRDADRKTLALARLLYQLKTQDCSQIEQLYILHKIYKNPAQAVSIQVDQIHPDYCIDRLLKKITGSWGKVSEVAMVRTNPPSYESERQIMNEFTMLILKQCAELSRELDIPMDEIVSLKKWSFDGDGKDFPDTHQIYHMLSTQVTLFTELRNTIRKIKFTLGHAKISKADALCDQIQKIAVDTISDLSKGSRISQPDASTRAEECIALLRALESTLAELPLIRDDIHDLRLIFTYTQACPSGNVYRQEGAIFLNVLAELGASIDHDTQSIEQLAMNTATLSTDAKRELRRLTLLQQSKAPQLVISQCQSADEIKACVRLNLVAATLCAQHPALQDDIQRICQSHLVSADNFDMDTATIPALSILTEDIGSMLQHADLIKAAIQDPIVHDYCRATGGIGEVKSCSDGSAQGSAFIRLIHQVTSQQMRTVCKDANIPYNESASYDGLGADDLLRTGSVFHPSGASTIQGSDMVNKSAPGALLFQALFQKVQDDNLSQLWTQDMPEFLAISNKIIHAHWDFEYGPLLQYPNDASKAAGKFYISSMLRRSNVAWDAMDSISLKLSARKNARGGAVDALQKALSTRRIAMVNNYAARSNGAAAYAWLSPEFTDAELTLLRTLYQENDSFQDLIFNAMLVLALHDPKLFTEYELGRNATIPDADARQRLAKLDPHTLRPSEVLAHRWAKHCIAQAQVLRNIVAIIWTQIPSRTQYLLDTLAKPSPLPQDYTAAITELLSDIQDHAVPEDTRYMAAAVRQRISGDGFQDRKALRYAVMVDAMALEDTLANGQASPEQYKAATDRIAEVLRPLGNLYGSGTAGRQAFEKRLEYRLQSQV